MSIRYQTPNLDIMQHFPILLLLLIAVPLQAQFGKNVEQHQFKVNILGPGLEYEIGIGQNETLNFRGALQFVTDPTTDATFEVDVVPAVTGQYRYYHNLGKRFQRQKAAYGNAGNYFAASASFFIGDPILSNIDDGTDLIGFVGPVYGIQRTHSSGLNINIEVGGGYYFEGASGGFGPTFNLSVGWILGEKRWCVGK